jgi:multidrug/hemolysin transport system ATP-binding protein
MNDIIRVEHLRKRFKDVKAVDDISFVVHEGELFAFLGLNGAGKSTTINMIAGALHKDSGSIYVDGFDVDRDLNEIRSSVGIVYQAGVLDKNLSVFDNLRYKAALYGYVGGKFAKRLAVLEKQLNLEPLLKRPLGKLSGGQRRRVDIARALFHEPRILILDEPTTGLDPQTRKEVWRVIDEEMNERGLTVFLTTHYMEEAAEAHYVVILDQGHIVAKGSPIDLKSRYSHDSLFLYHANEAALGVAKREKLAHAFKEGTLSIAIRDGEEAKRLIAAYPAAFVDFEVIKGRMDDVFLNATGKEFEKGVCDHA